MQEAITQLKRQLKAVPSKRPAQALCLWGEPGVGKTQAIREMLDQLPCRSFGLQASAPTILLTRVLPRPQDLPPEAEKAWESLAQGQSLEAGRLVKTLAPILSELAPVVLHLENLHEADEGRVEWVIALANLLPKLRGVGLLVSSRSAQPKPFQSYQLQRLSRSGSDALLNQHLNTALPPEGLEWIFERALGNPLFSLEYLTYLSRQGFFWSDGTRWHWRVPPSDFVPPSLEALIYEWVNHCEGRLREVLEARALLPQPISATIWAEVAAVEAPALAQAQGSLERAGLLSHAQVAHPLIAEVLRKELSPAQRKAYAARALTALERENLEPSPQIIAAANLGQVQTLQIYQRLAEEAKARKDLSRAGHWLALAGEQAQDEAQVLLALEAAQLLRHSDVNRALKLAQTAAYAPPHNHEAVYLCAELWMTQGNSEQAETLLGLLSAEERKSLRWWETLIRLHYSTHAGHDEVLRLWQLSPRFHAKANPETVLYVSAVLGQRGQFEAAFSLTGPLLERDLSPFLRSRALEAQAIFYYLLGQSEPALKEIEEAVALARTLDQPAYLAKLLRREGLYAENFNQFSRAVGNYREALKVLGEHGSQLDQAQVQTSLAPLLVDQGQYEEAESLYLQGLSTLNRLDNKILQCDARVGLALLYLDWKPAYGAVMALKHARAAVEIAQGTGNQQMLHSSLSTLAMAEAVFGDARKALELARQSATQGFTGPSAVRKGRSLYALGLALEANNRIGEAISALQESEQVHLKLGFEATAQRFGLELDRLTQNTPRAGERLEWFRSQDLMGGAKIALRYFPQLQPEAVVEAVQTSVPRLCLLGPSLLEQEGKTLPYRGKKRLELLAYLLETRLAGKAEATLLELMDGLYPETDEAGARATLKQLVYLLRNQLGPQSILSTASGYALGAIESDVERFLQTEDHSLWRGAYLEGLGEGWYPEVRERLLVKFGESVKGLLDSSPGEALRLAQLWQQMEPYEPDALGLGLRALMALGEGKKLERLYQQGLARFAEVGERLPQTPEAFLKQFLTRF